MTEKKPAVTALIPARGGSKSIPGKNIKELGGHPLIAYSIAAGLQSALVDRVIVSTDDEEIAAVSRSCGAETPFLRPAELAGDTVTDLPVFVHALNWLRDREGSLPDSIIHLRPTSPFRPVSCIDDAVRLLMSDPHADSVRGVTPSSENPFKVWQPGETYMTPLVQTGLHEAYNMPRQELPETYWHCGHVEAIRPAVILEQHSMSGKNILPLIIDPEYVVDIDTPNDWNYAEYLLGRGISGMVHPGPSPSLLSTGIELVIFDFDGVFTDDSVYVDQHGTESVRCLRGDGMGIALLRKAGIPCLVMSTETNPVVSARCGKLEIPCRQGITDKTAMLHTICREYGVPPKNTAYVGNDINDLGPMKQAGLAVAVRDAHPLIKEAAHIVLQTNGGAGAVREFCDRLILSKQHITGELS